MHIPGAQVSKPMQPVAIMCTSGAGSMFNLEQCEGYLSPLVKNV